MTRPPVTPICPRDELRELFDDMATIPLIVVSSWSGCGKTTFLADYAERCASVCLWYRATRRDDLGSMLYDLVASARDSHLLQNEHEVYWALDDVDASDLVTIKRFFVSLMNQINAPLLIVIDDFQEVQFHEEFHDVLRMACLALPRGSRIVVVNSGGCRLNLAKMRTAFPVAALEDQDFALSLNEVKEIAKLYGRQVTSAAEAHQLLAEVEGCASCLVAMLSDNHRAHSLESS